MHYGKTHIIRLLCWYNILVGCSIPMVANFIFIDRIMLRLHIDLGAFSFIKVVMSILPAILYTLLSGVLSRVKDYSRLYGQIYFARVLLPALLPFLGLMIDNKNVMAWTAAILLGIGSCFAVFAGNMQMVIYRQVIPEKDYNYQVSRILMFMSLPAILLTMPSAWVLDCCKDLSDRAFILIFGTLQFLGVFIEIPAYMIIKSIKLPGSASSGKSTVRKGLFWEPLKNRQYRWLILISFMQRLLNCITIAYMMVYFMEVVNMSMTLLTFITTVLCLTGTLILPRAGKVLDRIGYSKSFVFLAGCMLLGYILFCLFGREMWILPLFALLCWDGGGSIAAILIGNLSAIASSKLAAKEWVDSAISAYSFWCNMGSCCGFFLAGVIFNLVNNGDLATALYRYFWSLLPLYVIFLLMVIRFGKSFQPDRKHYSV